MPGRKYTIGNSYRYGFNGKERDKDITNGNYDFGSRIYDSRINRFLSIDPLWKDNTYESNYAYANNSPILMIDKNGENGEVSIIRNENGKGGVINVTTTVYVSGADAKNQVDKINKYMQSDRSKEALSGNYTDKDGNNWKINLQITYKVKDVKDKVKESENELVLHEDDRIAAGGVKGGKRYEDPYFKGEKGETRTLVGQKAEVGLLAYKDDIGSTVLHETLH